MTDIYYSPEKFGLSPVGEVHWDDEAYQFDLTAVWRNADDVLYWASDSGCSCPGMFEDYVKIEDLATGTIGELESLLADRLAEVKGSTYRGSQASRVEGEIATLIDRVRSRD